MKARSKKTVCISLAAAFCAATLAGCALNDAPLVKRVIADFTGDAEARSEVFASDGWENGSDFNTWWISDNVRYENGMASLYISEMKEEDKPANVQTAEYFGGEMRTTHFYGYGDYTVRMKPSDTPGTASTFFVCTGDYDKWYDEDGNVVKENPWDEIDIEFLGYDTTRVQFNYFAAGVGNHEKWIDLGFDASEEFHDYGFRWTPDDITWFVDNEPVYKVWRNDVKEGEGWPTTPGRIIMNYWCGTENLNDWMMEFEDDYDGHSDYEYISTTAEPEADPATTKPGTDGPQESEPIPEDIAWNEPVYIPFLSTDIYTVTGNEGSKSSTVTYTAAKKNSYSNVQATGLDAAGRNYFGATFAGKTDKDIALRVNLRGEDGDLVKKAYVSEGAVSIDGGAVVTVPAGGSVDVVIYYEGTLTGIELMIDSTAAAAENTNANTLEITNTKFGVKGEVVQPEPSKNQGVLIGGETVRFTGAGYTVESSADKKAMTVSYADVAGNGYATLTGDVSAVIGSNNTFTFKVTNNGTETAKVRVDVICPAGAGTNGYNFCNTSASVEGCVAQSNDYAYGGADWFTVAAGATATASIRFSTGVGANAITFYLDSSTYDDTAKHSGELTFSEMAFSATETEEPVSGIPEGIAWDETVLLAFASTDIYTVEADEAGKTLTVTYTAAQKDSYANVNVQNVQAEGKNWFGLTLASKTDKEISVRVNLRGGGQNLAKQAFVSAGQVSVSDGVMVTVPANGSVDVAVYYEGTLTDIELMIDSTAAAPQASNANTLEVSNMKFGVKGEVVVPEPEPEPEPEPANTITVNGAEVTVNGGVYTVSVNGETDSFTAAYEALAGGTYQNVSAYIETLAAGRNTFTATFTNNAAGSVRIRIDLQGTQKAGNTDVCNIVATVDNALVTDIYTDTNWGGTSFTLPAGETATVTVTYTGLGAQGAVKNLLLYFDTFTNEDTATHSGSVTVSGIAFSGEDKEEGSESGPAPAEDVPAYDGENWTEVSAAGFDDWDNYTVDKADGIRISHTAAVAQWACCGMDIAPGENNAYRMKITNNGTETAVVKISIKNDASAANAALKATVNGAAAEVVGGEVTVRIAAGESAELVIVIDTAVSPDKFVVSLNSFEETNAATGDITIRELAAKKAE